MERAKGLQSPEVSMSWNQFWGADLVASEPENSHYDLPYWPVVVLLVNFALIAFMGQ
jgi:hypothetical protein